MSTDLNKKIIKQIQNQNLLGGLGPRLLKINVFTKKFLLEETRTVPVIWKAHIDSLPPLSTCHRSVQSKALGTYRYTIYPAVKQGQLMPVSPDSALSHAMWLYQITVWVFTPQKSAITTNQGGFYWWRSWLLNYGVSGHTSSIYMYKSFRDTYILEVQRGGSIIFLIKNKNNNNPCFLRVTLTAFLTHQRDLTHSSLIKNAQPQFYLEHPPSHGDVMCVSQSWVWSSRGGGGGLSSKLCPPNSRN